MLESFGLAEKIGPDRLYQLPTAVAAHEAWAREQCPSGQEI